ncbi:hypothetical protein COLO4_00041 [Corchorus olitorius]|uniref:Uncharacterized protein n=1 Tax=Corchorus olitorius TaxID=93759 RepID=A0A1R3L4V4_9ROSI|nr:hypothetical protein COLO4_00041 [Corchorus olitorius]
MKAAPGRWWKMVEVWKKSLQRQAEKAGRQAAM